MATARAAAPLSLCVGQRKASRGASQSARNPSQSPGQQPCGLRALPGSHQCLCIHIRRRIHAQDPAYPTNAWKERSVDFQCQVPSQIAELAAFGFRHSGNSLLHPYPSAPEPFLLLLNVVIDLSARCPVRRVNAHLLRSDRKPQSAATARAAQLERHRGVAQRKKAVIKLG